MILPRSPKGSDGWESAVRADSQGSEGDLVRGSLQSCRSSFLSFRQRNVEMNFDGHGKQSINDLKD